MFQSKLLLHFEYFFVVLGKNYVEEESIRLLKAGAEISMMQLRSQLCIQLQANVRSTFTSTLTRQGLQILIDGTQCSALDLTGSAYSYKELRT